LNGAGDGVRTRDIRLGKPNIEIHNPLILFKNLNLKIDIETNLRQSLHKTINNAY
jgi:hypothetical protein